jgi:hypothetical protein
MSSAESPGGLKSKGEVVKSVWQSIRTRLESEKKSIADEIKNYPRPIPACDQQFNFLLEERTRIFQDLERLDAASQESLTGCKPEGGMEAFLQSSTSLASESGQAIRAALKEGLARLEV